MTAEGTEPDTGAGERPGREDPGREDAAEQDAAARDDARAGRLHASVATHEATLAGLTAQLEALPRG